MRTMLFSLGLSLAMVSGLVMPVVVQASSNAQDEDAQRVLQLLGIEVSDMDPLWYDPDFEAYLAKFKEFSNTIDVFGNSVLDLYSQAYELNMLGNDVNHEAFQEVYGLSDEEIAVIQAENVDLMAEFGLTDGSLSDTIFESFAYMLTSYDNEYDYSYDYDYDYSYIYADGYSSPYGYVEPGQIVWLYDNSYSSNYGSGMTVNWSQSVGPAVEWVDTEYPTSRAFIVPSFEGSYVTYLGFDIVASDGVNMDARTIFVDVISNDEQARAAVADIYWRVLNRAPDQSGLDYWYAQYQNGLSLYEIEDHFYLSDEYSALWMW